MVIGVDIDDTIADTSLLVSQYVKEHLSLSNNLSSFKKRLKKLMYGEIEDDEMKEFALNYLQEIILKVKAKEGVQENLKKLKENNRIVVITARSDKNFKDSYDVTYKWLIDNNIPFDKLICGAQKKVDECIEENVSLMLDDSIEVCNALNKNGIDAIVFNSKGNIEEDYTGKRISDWNEIHEIILNNDPTFI